MLFEIHAERSANDKTVFYYDNETNILKNKNGEVFQYPEIKENPYLKEYLVLLRI